MSNATTSYKIDLLNGDNYTAWRRRLKWILDDQDLWEVTTGTEAESVPAKTETVTPAEQQAITEWKKRGERARKEICLRISDEYLVYIDQIMTAPDIHAMYQLVLPCGKNSTKNPATDLSFEISIGVLYGALYPQERMAIFDVVSGNTKGTSVS
jgi:Domain of unknown function (DUF4219)